MWKIFAGFIAFALLSLFVIMKGGDKVDIQGEAANHSGFESASAQAATSATASPSAPVVSAPAPALPAAGATPAADTVAQPGKMSTTGTIVVDPAAASAATSK